MSLLPEKFRYIVVEGPIGVGKTSLARLLGERAGGAALTLEDAEANPFLRGFYRDMPRYAFSAQMFFLFQRVNQLAQLKQPNLFQGLTVSDFLLEKDQLFARLTLSDDEFALYQKIYRHLAPQIPTPDLVIYLQAPVEVLIQRVEKRGNAFERNIPEDYMRKLSESYTRFFYQYNASPLLIVNSQRLNFVDRPQDFDLLLQRIASLKGGREFFNRG
jgi:deoxyguanosine kinase